MDVGCSVGSAGHIYAMDMSQKQLDVMKKRLTEKNINNVTLFSGDIYIYNQTVYHKADLIYSKLLLMHLRQQLNALKNMRKLLKDKGKVSLQESMFSLAQASSQNEIYDRYINILLALGQSKGVDYNIGNKLSKLSVEADFINIDAHIY